ncbi:hypothetical protein VKT23_011592 [Stygiomarasmius scandens]|uniref:Uncharacterized protein n=1 Tax=Marasmiellus scandens TaxID=2682957 RepID=A0ABR1J9G4_9AGAR
MSQTTEFKTGKIYATIFVAASGFHYTLSLMMNKTTAKKLHARELSPGNFVFEAANQTIAQSNSLCVALEIGSMSSYSVEQIIQLLQSIPMVLPECDVQTDGRFRCRVWLKQALRVLNLNGIIKCSDADKVVNGELKVLAKENSDNVERGVGSFKVYVSRYSA